MTGVQTCALPICLQINMLMAAAVCAVIASNLGMFVVMAEVMALCAVFLTSNSKEGKLWFALGRLGTLLLEIACWLLWQRYGTLDLRLLDMRMQQLPLGSDIWLLGVIGFGLLAGIIPLHGWVPQAHANASAPDRKSTRLNSSHLRSSRMPSSA